RGVVIFREEECRERSIERVLAEKLVYSAQQPLWLVERNGTLAPQIRLQVSHEQSGRDAFSGNVADDQAEAAPPQVEKIVIVTADFARLDASTRIFQRVDGGKGLREEPSLHLSRDFDLLRGAPFGFDFCCLRAPSRFERVRNFVEADQGEDVPVDVAKTGEDAAPDRCLLTEHPGRSSNLRLLLAVEFDALQAWC